MEERGGGRPSSSKPELIHTQTEEEREDRRRGSFERFRYSRGFLPSAIQNGPSHPHPRLPTHAQSPSMVMRVVRVRGVFAISVPF